MDFAIPFHWPVEAIAAVCAGILILAVPRVLNYAVAVYLLIVGILGLAHYWHLHSIRPQSVLALVAGILILLRPAILNYVVGIYLILLGFLESGVVRW